MRTWAGGVVLGVACFLGAVGQARAYYLDSGRNFDVRLRAYSQLGIMAESSSRAGCQPKKLIGANASIVDPRTCPPTYDAGDLAQERNFYNPEFDARLTDYVRWTKEVPVWQWFSPDDFKFRFAWWGFYDGIYDYLDPEWNDRRRSMLTRFSQSDSPGTSSYFFKDEGKNPRRIYASRNRINELYLDYTKGPVFLRVGRQAISWGESDTIALLDISNPFDLTLGAPGLYQDVDEARIPLWTLRGTVKLLETWKAISSVFLDAYMVPGPIDTTVPINPIAAGVSPFNPDQSDPQFNLIYGSTLRPGSPNNALFNQSNLLHTVVVDKLPPNTWSNTRWGARLTGVLLRDYTVQGWFFRTFNEQPAPYLSNVSGFKLSTDPKAITLIDNRGFRLAPGECIGTNGAPIPKAGGSAGRTRAGRPCSWAAPVVTTLQRQLESVIGIAASWFSEPVNGIIRTEAEYFVDEAAFVPEINLNPRTQVPASIRKAQGDTKRYFNTVPTADYIRWVIGYDTFFFMRALNPSNSFTLITSFNNSFNLSEHSGLDFRNPVAKPGKLQAEAGPIPGTSCKGHAARRSPLCTRVVPHNFVDAYQYEGFFQTVLRTDYMHAALQPQLLFIADLSGIFVVAPSLTYRVNDNLLLSGTYLAIAGPRTAGPGTFRDHDMLQLRMTVQLN